MLTEIHEGHTGIVRMKAVARMHVWWPNIDCEIESCVYECDDCQRNSRNPARAPLHPWEQPEKPWKRLHIDFAGPFCGSMWLILVDAQSKWPEVIQMKSTTASKTVEVLRSLFSRFGIPHQLVSEICMKSSHRLSLAALNVCTNLSASQFELGWYGTTNVHRIPFCSQNSLYSSDTNWGPLSGKGQPQTELQRNQITAPVNWKMRMQTCMIRL